MMPHNLIRFHDDFPIFVCFLWCNHTPHCCAGLYGILKSFVVFLLSDYTGPEPPLHVISKKSRHVDRTWSEAQVDS